MQDWLLVIFVAGLANAQFVDTWKNGSIFKRPRAFFEPWEESPRLIVRWFGELILCSRCFTHWTAIPAFVLLCWYWDVEVRLLGWPFLWIATVGMSRVAYRLAGGDEEEEERDPILDIKPYELPDASGSIRDSYSQVESTGNPRRDEEGPELRGDGGSDSGAGEEVGS